MTDQDEVKCFEKGEKVLCYEPDPAKTQLLYDSKVLNVYESRDNTGRKYYEYKVHFLSWSRTWDRKVRKDYLLKDNEENRQLQRELAEKEKLEISSGSNSYKDRTGAATAQTSKKLPKKRKAAGLFVGSGSAGGLSDQFEFDDFNEEVEPVEAVTTGRVRDTSAVSGGGGRVADRHAGDGTNRREDKAKTHTNVNTAEYEHKHHRHQGKRVELRISERLKKYLEYDYEMIVSHGKQHYLPARQSIVEILEDFVKLRSVELALTIKNISSRPRSTQQHTEKMEREYERVMSTVSLLKEVADGLRIYFDFLIEDCLLYKEERAHTAHYLTPDYLTRFQRKPADAKPWLCNDDSVESQAMNGDILTFGSDEYKAQLGHYLSIIENTSRSQTSAYAAAETMSTYLHDYLLEVFAWQLLPDDVPAEQSMIFGAPHLARLLVKLPEYLSASPLSDDKLELLLKHLDSFIKYLESHQDWFNEKNYLRFHKKRGGLNESSIEKHAEKQLHKDSELKMEVVGVVN